MCGIIGNNYNFNNTQRDRAMSSIEHRGIDAKKHEEISLGLFFGQSRLAIVDHLSGANQPFSNDRYSLVFNGEIYNYKEIKATLQNYDFATKSDTEVILASITEDGIDHFLKVANGMFSISVYDKRTNKITLMRDRLGIKPLFYSFYDGKLAFGSTLKSVYLQNKMNGIANDLRAEAIGEYLTLRQSPAPKTFFEGIFQVKPGEKITFGLEEGEIIKEIYYRFPPNAKISAKKDSEIVSDIDKLIRSSIELRMRSDVPLGTFLSGGVDSSLISVIASEKRFVNAYTIGDVVNNEFEFADKISGNFDLHKIIFDSNNYLDEGDELINLKGEPLMVPNEIAIAKMAKNMKKDITVVLSGEGADELFFGYGRIMQMPFDYKKNGNQEFTKLFSKKYSYADLDFVKKYFTIVEKNVFPSKINDKYQYVYDFFRDVHIKALLNRLDASTMAYGIEARVPFLDHRLIEYVIKNIPVNELIKWKEIPNDGEMSSTYSEIKDIPKYYLKQVAEKYIPKEIIYRKKVGFPIMLNEMYSDLLLKYTGSIEKSKGLKIKDMETFIDEIRVQKNYGQILWMIINIVKMEELYEKI